MNPSRWKKIDELFDAAMERPADQRSAFLLEACQGDEDLRREVESLLDAHDRSGTFIEESPAPSRATEILEWSQGNREMIGRTLGHYRLTALLGAGGMGQVYAAKDLNLGRQVAIKVLPPHLAAHPEALARFRREAMAVAALSHPNILAIHDFGIETGISYAVMELLRGETLRSRLQSGPVSWREAVDICLAVTDGLASAHSRGIIHRDIKPENIFMTAGGGVKILDFGIARVIDNAVETGVSDDPVQTTRPGTLMGTIGYMSPEQVRGETADAPSDLFSLGCMLVEMLTAERPFARDTAAETMAAILRDDLPAGTLSGRAIPAALEAVIGRCLRKDSRERYQSASLLAADLRSLLSQTSPVAAPTDAPVISSSRRSPRRALWIAAATAVALILAAAGAWRLLNRGAEVTSIAVLPFANSNSDPDLNYLCEGLTEQVIGALSRVPKMRILAKSTVKSAVEKFKGESPDPRSIGRDLNVKAVMVGRISRSGDDLLISAELVSSADGSLLWGDSYRQPNLRIETVQDDILRSLTGKLDLASNPNATGGQKRTSNSESYQLYLKGLYFIQQESREDGERGLKLLDEAIRQDPTNAQAYAGLAQGYFNLSNVYMPPDVAMPKARAAAMRALDLDPTLADAHAILAVVKSHYDFDWPAAEASYRRALQLNPNNAFAHNMFGYYLTAMGHTDEALSEYAVSRELDPLSPSTTIAWPYYFARPDKRRYDRAAEELRKLIRYNPEFPAAHGLLGLVLCETERYDEAIAELREALKIADSPWFLAGLGYVQGRAGKRADALRTLDELKVRDKSDQHVQALSFAYLYAGLNDAANAVAWLEKSYQKHEEELILINVDPKFDRLRDDPRFKTLINKMRF